MLLKAGYVVAFDSAPTCRRIDGPAACGRLSHSRRDYLLSLPGCTMILAVTREYYRALSAINNKRECWFVEVDQWREKSDASGSEGLKYVLNQ